MNNEKVRTLLLRLDKTLRELAKETDAEHISAYIVGGKTSIDDYTDIYNPKFKYFKDNKGESIYYE